MRKRRWLLIGLGVVGLAAALVVLWPRPERPAVTLARLMRLEPGMSEAEVDAVLGPPAADLTAAQPVGGGRLLEYVGERMSVKVEFDEDGRYVRCTPNVREVNLEERIRLRLNWW